MKKLFIILFGLVVVILMVGCLNLEGIFPFLNQAPVIISEPIITTTENNLYSYQVEASDPNGDNLSYFLVIKPEGMKINGENGLITWVSTNEQVGIHKVIIEVSDGKYNVSQNFEIEVFNVNDPPLIFSYFPVNLNFEINEGNSVKFEVQAHDIDLNTSLNYQWLLNEKKVSSSTVSGNGSKSSWIYSASYGDYNQEIVKILVSDGELEDYVQWNITINDITPPAQPNLNTVISPTNISSQTLSGTKETNSSIWLNGVEVVHLDSSLNWSYSYNLIEGNNNISITSCDATGNESLSASAVIVLDTGVPEITILDAVFSPTNVSPQTLSGTKEANASIWINGVEVISVNSDTTWSYCYNLSEGENSISIISKDSAGNESNEINTTIILDTTAPAAPTLDTVVSLTNTSTQILSGTKEANTSIWINNIEIIPINSGPTWTYDFNLSEGENNISITSRDSAGNESSGANAKIILDSILPTTPTLNEVITPTNVSIQVLFGTKETNSSIWLNGVEVISLNSYTDWSYSYNLSEGTNNISIASRDMVGNESSAITSTIEYDPDIYVDAANTTGIEDGTKTHPFNTIAEGIDAVAPGKSVMVAEGTYNEQLIINKEGITLQGADKENTFINGASVNGNLIILEADCITITGFTIDGDGSASIGIYFNNYSSININNNIIQNNSNYGINYSNSSPTIENNNIKNNNYSGIDVGTGGAGIIRNNFAVSNKYGIHTYGDSSPEITGNNIINNNTGIYCRESATPIISYNTIGNNDYCGILIHNLSGNLVNPDIGNEYPSQGQSAGRNKITGNNNYGIYNKTNHRINAENNWWGDTNGPIWSGNTTTTGDRVYCDVAGGIINFFPWLSVAP